MNKKHVLVSSVLYLLIGFSVIVAVACGKNQENGQGSTKGEQSVVEEDLTDDGLDRLVEAYIPVTSPKDYQPVEDGKGFPPKLINKLGKAVYEGNTASVLSELDDESLRLTEEEIQGLTDDLDGLYLRENEIHYGCDTDGDGKKEIFSVPAGRDSYLGNISAYVYDGEKYVYNGYQSIGSVRNYAIFQYEGIYYLAVDCSTGSIRQTDARLYRLTGEDLRQDKPQNRICMLKKDEISNQQPLYKNNSVPYTDDLQLYVEEIIYDLIEVQDGYGIFYGDEKEQEGEANQIYAIDTNNDGTSEYFERMPQWLFGYGDGIGRGGEMELQWFDQDGRPSTWPLTLWNNPSYVRVQTWFKIFDGKTIAFSLYHSKDLPYRYVLDGRIRENEKTTLLFDYQFTLEDAGIELARPDMIGVDGLVECYVSLEEYYCDPDREKAFPENGTGFADTALEHARIQYVFDYVDDDSIPLDLEEAIKAFLLQDQTWEDRIDSYSSRLDKYDFLYEYGDFIEGSGLGASDDNMEYVYQYDIGGETYFLAPAGIPWITSVNYSFFKEMEGELSRFRRYGSTYAVTVLTCGDALYFMQWNDIEKPKYLWGCEVHRVAPDQEDDYITVSADLTGYRWEEIYNNKGRYEKAVTEYIDSVRDTLMEEVSGTEKNHTGDEKEDFDYSLRQRLESFRGEQFYEIDFDNNGISEYVSKDRVHSMAMDFNIYRFENNRTITVNYDLESSKAGLDQLWFKRLEDKVFTFKMVEEDRYYFLNVSLVEGADITQICSYLILPELEYKKE